MKKYFAKFIVALTVMFVLGACSQTNAIETGQAAPDFSLTDINGNTVKLSDYKGKVIILDFFASWCPPCRQEIPDFIDLQKTYGDKGFTMVGVAMVSQADAKSFAESEGINYPVVVDDNKVSRTYGPIRSIPTTFVIDKDFKIAKLYIGYRAKDVFEKDIKELVK